MENTKITLEVTLKEFNMLIGGLFYTDDFDWECEELYNKLLKMKDRGLEYEGK